MNDSKRTTLAALCAASLLMAIAVPAAAADTLVATDTTWRVTSTGPATGWDKLASFDDTAWQSATVIYDVGTVLGSDYAGTKAIWTQAGQFSTTDTTIWGRTVFNLAAAPQDAILKYGLDDDGDIWVNGTLVISDHDGLAGGGSANVSPYLVAGNNVIAFVASDNYQTFGYNHQIWVQVQGTAAAVPAVPEASTYAMLLLGLGLVGMTRLRRAERH